MSIQHEYFLKIAEAVAQQSKDPSTKVGAVIVGADKRIRGTGYNGFASGIEYTKERLERPLKYTFMVHAEQNAVIFTGRERAEGCTMYFVCIPESNGSPYPCVECTKAIINAGIKHLVTYKVSEDVLKKNYGSWRELVVHSETMLKEAGITITYV